MRIHHLNCGTLRPPGGRVTFGGGEVRHLVCHCLLLETSAGLVLVDTGLGTGDVRSARDTLPWWFRALLARPALRSDETALMQVQALGFSPSDVRHIVLTHLDLDHAGGVLDFPNATVHVLQPELEAAEQRRTVIERQRYRPAQFSGARFRTYAAAGEAWRGFSASRPVVGVPDVLMVPLPGHTRGHTAVAVRTERGWLLHCGDAYFHRDELDGSMPMALRAFQRTSAMDVPRMQANHARLREVATRTDEVELCCTHDPVQYAQMRAASTGTPVVEAWRSTA